MTRRMLAVVIMLVALLVLTVIGTVVAFTLSIWTGDERWGMTGILGIFVAFLLAFAAAMTLEAS